jgi:hypothetical protein
MTVELTPGIYHPTVKGLQKQRPEQAMPVPGGIR